MRVLLAPLLLSTCSAFVPTALLPLRVQPLRIRVSVPTAGADDGPRDLGVWAKTVVSNINEGELGTRGEQWFFGQLVLVLPVLAAPYLNLKPPTAAAGLLLFAASAALAAGSAFELGGSLSPWTAPVASNELKTDGLFALCRHPIYTGLTGVCAGLSLASLSAERLLVTAALLAFLDRKSRSEEAQLEQLHGDAYREWAAATPRFLPAWAALERYIDAKAGVLEEKGDAPPQ